MIMPPRAMKTTYGWRQESPSDAGGAIASPSSLPSLLRTLAVCPGGTSENSPAFQRWDRCRIVLSPAGTAEPACLQPSLRDSCHTTSTPSVETLGYSHPSLRDEGIQTLTALESTEPTGRAETPREGE